MMACMVPDMERILLARDACSHRFLRGRAAAEHRGGGGLDGKEAWLAHMRRAEEWSCARPSSHARLIRNWVRALFLAKMSAIFSELPCSELMAAKKYIAEGTCSSGHDLHIKFMRLPRGLNLLNDSDAHSRTESTFRAVSIRITAEQT